MSDDLVTWLRAQLDEDERVARASWQGNGWRHENQPSEVWTGKFAPGHTCIPIAKAWDEPTAEHIARHDPARALLEVEARRRIIAAHPLANEPGVPPHCETCRYVRDEDDPEPFPEAGYPCPTVRLLALPHADRDGYREEWRA
jgi:Family of unknown function (DUF6221)